MNQFGKYVGPSVHKDSIAVFIADAGRSKARFYGTIKNTSQAVSSLHGATDLPVNDTTENADFAIGMSMDENI